MEKESEDIAMESKAATATEIKNILAINANNPINHRNSKRAQDTSISYWNSLSNLKFST